MKLQKPYIAAALLATPALFAFAPLGSKLAFTVSEGATKTKTFNNVVEMTMDDMSMLMNGQENPMMPDMQMTILTDLSVVVVDEYQAMGEGRPKKLLRLYETIEQASDISMEMDMAGNVESNEMSVPTDSELEGMQVLFTWDGDSGEYIASYPEGEGDDELLEGLQEDMDLRLFLPSGEVAEGDEWKVDPKALMSIMAPGGDLKLLPEDVDSADMMGMNQDMGDFSDWFNKDLEGEVTATFSGTRETEDGTTVGVISIRGEMSNAVDMTEKVSEMMDELPPGVEDMQINSMDMAVDYEGEGTLLWDLAAGCAHSMEMTGDFAMIIDTAMDITAQGTSMEIEQSMEFSGSLTSSASVE